VRKPHAQGIHGTLFYQLDYKKEYYPSKRESDVAGPPHSPAAWLSVPEPGLSDTPGEDPGSTNRIVSRDNSLLPTHPEA
jgi:hypothetical protein